MVISASMKSTILLEKDILGNTFPPFLAKFHTMRTTAFMSAQCDGEFVVC